MAKEQCLPPTFPKASENQPTSALGQLGQALIPIGLPAVSCASHPRGGSRRAGHLNGWRWDILDLMAQAPPWPVGVRTRLFLASFLRAPHQGEAWKGM